MSRNRKDFVQQQRDYLCLPNNYFIFPSITTNVLSINRNKYKISIKYIPVPGIPHRIIFLPSGYGIFILPRDRKESRESLSPLPVAQIGYGWNPVPVGWYWCTERPIRSSNSLQHSGVLAKLHPEPGSTYRQPIIRNPPSPHGWCCQGYLSAQRSRRNRNCL